MKILLHAKKLCTISHHSLTCSSLPILIIDVLNLCLLSLVCAIWSIHSSITSFCSIIKIVRGLLTENTTSLGLSLLFFFSLPFCVLFEKIKLTSIRQAIGSGSVACMMTEAYVPCLHFTCLQYIFMPCITHDSRPYAPNYEFRLFATSNNWRNGHTVSPV